MSVSYQDVRSERQWKATTGLSQEEFCLLCASFARAYELQHSVSLPQSQANLHQHFVLNSYEEALYFVLFQLKNDLSADSLGVVFGMDGSTAWRNFQRYVPVLEGALRLQGALPRRHFANVQQFQRYVKGEKALRLDTTEYPTQRPAAPERQQAHYSGKKKPTQKRP